MAFLAREPRCDAPTAGVCSGMTEVTRLLDGAVAGDKQAAAAVLPVVYDELRKLAAGHLAREAPGQTLTATALVHEAYLRLVASPGREPADEGRWAGRGTSS